MLFHTTRAIFVGYLQELFIVNDGSGGSNTGEVGVNCTDRAKARYGQDADHRIRSLNGYSLIWHA